MIPAVIRSGFFQKSLVAARTATKTLAVSSTRAYSAKVETDDEFDSRWESYFKK